MSKLDFSSALDDLDAVGREADELLGALHASHGERIDLGQFFEWVNGKRGRILDIVGLQAARIHNAKYDRLFKKMADEGMTYDEAVTSCDKEDRVIGGGVERKTKTVIAESEQEQTHKHLRSVLSKAARIHDQDGTPFHHEWAQDVQSFYIYAGERPSNKHTFGCINHKLGFVPGNVRWQTRDDVLVAMGRRMVEYNGKQVTLTQLSNYTGVNVATIRARYESGKRGADLWNDRRLNGKYLVDFGGSALTLSEAARRFGIHESTLRARLLAGATGDALFSRPKRGQSLKERGKALAPAHGKKQWADDNVGDE